MDNNTIQIFNFKQNSVRVIEQDGEAWFVGKDVAEALGYERTADAIKVHVYDEDKGVCVLPTPGGNQQATIINEPGVYSLIFSSKLPAAKEFKHWVTHEVLPDIRKYGFYLGGKARQAATNTPEEFDSVVKAYIKEKEKCEALEAEIANSRQFTNLGKIVIALPGSISIAEAAQLMAQKGIDIGRNRLYKLGRDKNLLSKQKKHWNKPTQKGIESGLVNLELDNNGEYKFSVQTMLTPKAVERIFKELFSESYPLLVSLEDM